jgi:hypothetical protein
MKEYELVLCPANNLFNSGPRCGMMMLYGQAECGGGGECG